MITNSSLRDAIVCRRWEAGNLIYSSGKNGEGTYLKLRFASGRCGGMPEACTHARIPHVHARRGAISPLKRGRYLAADDDKLGTNDRD